VGAGTVVAAGGGRAIFVTADLQVALRLELMVLGLLVVLWGLAAAVWVLNACSTHHRLPVSTCAREGAA